MSQELGSNLFERSQSKYTSTSTNFVPNNMIVYFIFKNTFYSARKADEASAVYWRYQTRVKIRAILQ